MEDCLGLSLPRTYSTSKGVLVLYSENLSLHGKVEVGEQACRATGVEENYRWSCTPSKT